MKLTRLAYALLAAAIAPGAAAFDIGSPKNPDRQVTVHGSVQVDALFPEEDAVIGTEKYKEKLLGNVYANAGLFSKYVDAGLRIEYLEHPMPGFTDQGFKGWGVGNFYATGKYKGFQLTAGDFYEQFGSGLILRTYEDRSLGIDNAIRGGRLKIDALRGFHFTLLGGVQRRYWDWSTNTRLYGADVEWEMQEHIKPLARHGIVWTLGASWVAKQERYGRGDSIRTTVNDRQVFLNLPERVNAMDVRTHFNKGDFDIQAEFAWKHADPSADNNYTFRRGTALMLSASYTRSGLSALVQAKRSEDMSFRSQRSMTGLSTFINNMPPFAYQHTYALASMYPYATQNAPGEWAFQADFAYTFKRKTALGGRYGTKLRVNFSYIRGIDREGQWKTNDKALWGTDGLKTKFFGLGDLYYQDVNVQVDKKLSRVVSLNAMYMFQRYNQTVMEGHGGIIDSHIAVAEGKFRCSDKVTLRAELQGLFTKQDKGDWVYGLVEVSVLPYLMIGASDQWNVGNKEAKTHYYMFNVTGNYRNNRLMFGYGRTREGYNCSGGVCRYVPATRGFQLTYSYNF